MPAPVNTVPPNITVGVGNVGNTSGPSVDKIVWNAQEANIQGKKLRVVFDVVQIGAGLVMQAGQASSPAQDFSFTPVLGTNTFTFTVGHPNIPQLTATYSGTTDILSVLDNLQVYDATPTTLITGWLLTATSTSFAISGPATSLKSIRKLSATQASYTYTPQTTSLVGARKLTAATKALAFTVIAAGLKTGRNKAEANTNYTISSFSTAVTSARDVTAQKQAYTITGPDSAFNVGGNQVTFGVIPTSYSITTIATNLDYFKLQATQASYSIISTATVLLKQSTHDRFFTPSAASYVETAESAVASYGRQFVINPVTFAVTGPDISFAVANAIQLAVGATQFSVTVPTTALLLARAILPAARAYSVVGSGTMKIGYRLVPIQASYALTGEAVVLKHSILLTVQTSFVTSASAVVLRVGHITLPATASYIITVPSVRTLKGIHLLTSAGSYTIGSAGIGFTYNRQLTTSAATYTIRGAAVVTAGKFLFPDKVAYTIIDFDSNYSFGIGFASVGSSAELVAVTGEKITMLRGKRLPVDTVDYVIDPPVLLTYGPSPPAPTTSNRRIKLRAQDRTAVIPPLQ